MSEDGESMNSVLAALHHIQRDIDLHPDPRQSDFKHCRALTKTKNRQCRRKASRQNITHATAMLASFEGFSKLPSDDSFFTAIHSFIAATHCSQHYEEHYKDNSFDKFKEWRDTRLTTIVTAQLETIEIVGEDLSDVKSFVDDSHGSTSIPEYDNFLSSSPTSDVTAGLSTLNITTTQQSIPTLTEDAEPCVRKYKENQLGQIQSRCQSIAIENDGRLSNAFYKILNRSEQKKGIVYVYEHEKLDSVFKIGFTKRAAEKRRGDYKNCYAMDTKLVYHTETGPFFGALRAETLAKEMLRRENLNVTECRWCKKGHKEWFEASREVIFDAVRMAEDFVRLPGYVLRDGVYKISKHGVDVYHQTLGFTPERMKYFLEEKLIQLTDETVALSTNGRVVSARQSVTLASPPPPTLFERTSVHPDTEASLADEGGSSTGEIPWVCQDWAGLSFFTDERDAFAPKLTSGESLFTFGQDHEAQGRDVSPKQMAFGLMLSMMRREIKARYRSSQMR